MSKLWIGLILFSSSVLSSTLIVSDIDDTIKISHSRDRWDALGYAFQTQSRFKGMAKLLTLLDNSQEENDFYYLTNAPKWAMEQSHRQLIKEGKFPQKKIIFREELDDQHHKPFHLKNLIEKHRPKRIILIGDNGENDPKFYHQVSERLKESGVEVYVFIHALYSESMFQEQYSFITSLDLAILFKQFKLISLENMVDHISQGLEAFDLEKVGSVSKYDPQFFPEWLNCDLYQWQASGFPGGRLSVAVKQKLEKVCQ